MKSDRGDSGNSGNRALFAPFSGWCGSSEPLRPSQQVARTLRNSPRSRLVGAVANARVRADASQVQRSSSRKCRNNDGVVIYVVRTVGLMPVSAAGESPMLVTAETGAETNPAFPPDGRHFRYARVNSKHSDGRSRR